jgi:periplasmic protein TonB
MAAGPRRERRWSVALSGAVHAAVLILFLAQARQVAAPPAQAPPPPVSLALAPEPPEPPEPPAPQAKTRDDDSPRSFAAPAPAAPAAPAASIPAPPLAPPFPTAIAAGTPALTGPGAGSSADGGDGSGDRVGSGEGEGGAGASPRQGFDVPQWIRKPTPEEMVRAMPYDARQEGISGRAILSCRVTAGNRVRACRVLEESPHGYGFGGAALILSRRFLIRPPVRAGEPRYDLPVRIPVYWSQQ